MAGKTSVLGILKLDDQVCVNVIRDGKKEQLMPMIEGKPPEGSTIYSDGSKSYDGLICKWYRKFLEFYKTTNNKVQWSTGK